MNSAVVGTTALAVIVLAAFVDDRETRVGPQDRGPALVLLDSIVLQETDDLYVGRAGRCGSGPDSSCFVVDPLPRCHRALSAGTGVPFGHTEDRGTVRENFR